MGKPAAKLGDQVIGVDTHIIMVPAFGGPVPTPFPHPFNGKITSGISTNVLINGRGAATLSSKVTNIPPHVPCGPGPFGPPPPTNNGIVMKGSSKVLINGKPASTLGDSVTTCDSVNPMPVNRNSKIITGSTNVLIGSSSGMGGGIAGAAKGLKKTMSQAKEAGSAFLEKDC